MTIDGEKHDHDIAIYPDKTGGRKKWITKERHGTSHKFAREEMEEHLEKVDTDQIEKVIVGTGQYGKLGLLDGAEELLVEEGVEIVEVKTPEAARLFSEGETPRGQKLGIFHVTC
ncbi:hypothetical protein AKJ64_04440 [candidate division MSBL1 archaeon SCGC-AAA259E17]|uniref:Dinitrogenase iron-molybdenum cofactor biosynthesis domain-containing protein n=1 Tax=candidate division MSBL1 archaeon SCGC-AAA259E17 TaxID=1698263 RepID=A0A133UCB6_9EURY|nr:hypothetical protein AKJ64_04440 [candidate division MSBL1 archaeon SCGC-AAA259E17]